MSKFNVGCGTWYFGPGWTHVDGGNFKYIDSHDIYLSEYKRGGADLIYASHFIEYFDRTEAVDVITVWRKVLKDQGILRLSVPNFSKLCSSYGQFGLLKDIYGPLYGKMRMGDRWIYHKTVYDYNSLYQLLGDCGFKDIHKWHCHKTEHSVFDDCSHADISLNLEGTK